MDALVIHAPGDLRVEEVATPRVGPDQLRVRVRAGGICGSDLHYFQHGGFGTVRIQEPMVLGHEVAGVIEEAGSAVRDFAPGVRIAICPSRPVRRVPLLPARPAEPLPRHALLRQRDAHAARAGRVPQGNRRRHEPGLCLADGISDGEGAMAEPLAVAIHAVNRAGPLLGKAVLVTGCGPIGAMLVVAARRAGATLVVVTDVVAQPLRRAAKVGADETINIAEHPDALQKFSADKGRFDVLLEASGNVRALTGAFDALRPRGIVVQVGLGGEMTLPINTIVAKEFDLRGAFRFHQEFRTAVDLINSGLVDLKPLVSATLSYRDAGRAFALAADRSQSMKVLLDFDD
jgi:L-idonate 5-dehydrogenase